MGGGHIIIGGEIFDLIKADIGKLAPFRQSHFLSIYAKYKHNENSVDRADQLFVLRSAADLLDQ